MATENPRWWGNEDMGEMLEFKGWPSPYFRTIKGWFFYDETWSRAYGPFNSKDEATISGLQYAEKL